MKPAEEIILWVLDWFVMAIGAFAVLMVVLVMAGLIALLCYWARRINRKETRK